MPIETYLSTIDDKAKEKILPIISYIEKNYKEAVFDEKYSEKTYIPTWRLNGRYVAVGCRKNYISVYFGSAEAIEAVKNSINSSNVTVRKGCVNIRYGNIDFPYGAIYKGIDECFK